MDTIAKRSASNIELIASENVVSKKAVMAAQKSILTNMPEGYPSRHYYGGTNVVDVVSLAIDR